MPSARRLPCPGSSRRWWWAGAAAASVALAACASTPPLPEFRQPVILFGEVHDNAAGHAWRLRGFEALLARGDRPALVLEMFDRTDQPAIDAARRQSRSAADFVEAVIAARLPDARSAAGWDWRFYTPYLAHALRLDLPIVAGNVGRTEARQIMRQGLDAAGFDADVPPDITQALAQEIVDSHCGHVDAATARRMVQAQVARDQQMARAVSAHAGRGVVLLAGNGHVRKDLGVPRWLDAATRTRTQVIGVVEGEDGDASAAYDLAATVAPQPRPDPCAGMKPAAG